MRRLLLNFLTVLSLLVCLATVAAWAASYWSGHHLECGTLKPEGEKGLRARSMYGQVYRGSARMQVGSYDCRASDYPGVSSGGQGFWSYEPFEVFIVGRPLRPSLSERLGFDADYHTVAGPGNEFSAAVTFPLWLPTLLGALPPFAWYCRRVRRRRRAAAGFPVEPPAPSSPPRV